MMDGNKASKKDLHLNANIRRRGTDFTKKRKPPGASPTNVLVKLQDLTVIPTLITVLIYSHRNLVRYIPMWSNLLKGILLFEIRIH